MFIATLEVTESVALNLGKCLKFTLHAEERRQREAQSERRYTLKCVLLTSELRLVCSIYMTLFVTTSLPQLHRKRQSEQTGKMPS